MSMGKRLVASYHALRSRVKMCTWQLASVSTSVSLHQTSLRPLAWISISTSQLWSLNSSIYFPNAYFRTLRDALKKDSHTLEAWSSPTLSSCRSQSRSGTSRWVKSFTAALSLAWMTWVMLFFLRMMALNSLSTMAVCASNDYYIKKYTLKIKIKINK